MQSLRGKWCYSHPDRPGTEAHRNERMTLIDTNTSQINYIGGFWKFDWFVCFWIKTTKLRIFIMPYATNEKWHVESHVRPYFIHLHNNKTSKQLLCRHPFFHACSSGRLRSASQERMPCTSQVCAKSTWLQKWTMPTLVGDQVDFKFFLVTPSQKHSFFDCFLFRSQQISWERIWAQARTGLVPHGPSAIQRWHRSQYGVW